MLFVKLKCNFSTTIGKLDTTFRTRLCSDWYTMWINDCKSDFMLNFNTQLSHNLNLDFFANLTSCFYLYTQRSQWRPCDCLRGINNAVRLRDSVLLRVPACSSLRSVEQSDGSSMGSEVSMPRAQTSRSRRGRCVPCCLGYSSFIYRFTISFLFWANLRNWAVLLPGLSQTLYWHCFFLRHTKTFDCCL